MTPHSPGSPVNQVNSWQHLQQWIHHPERSRTRNLLFQIHLATGAVISAYIFMMSLSGSVIVFRNQLGNRFNIGWLVDLHENLHAGSIGRLVNGAGAVCLTLLCFTGAVIWWPGIKNWRRSLTVNWKTNFGRINWDLHSALGFWCVPFLLMWGISGMYFCFPHIFDALLLVDRADHFTDRGLFLLSNLHFGRFDWFTQALWSMVALVPAVLAFTGVFICCRRMIFKTHSNPNHPPPAPGLGPLA